jgi:ribonuclease BN (tRNA processing enzyme)
VSRDPNLLDAIYITHLHADHSFGLPALLLWMREAGRERGLPIIGGSGVARWLTRLLDLGYPGSYERPKCYAIDAHELLPEARYELGRVTLLNARSDHVVNNHSVRIEEAGHSVCYSGDGAPSEATLHLYRDADLLVHECYSLNRDVPGHAKAVELIEQSKRQRVKRLCLIHISRTDKQHVRDHVAKHVGVPDVSVAEPGTSVAIDDD